MDVIILNELMVPPNHIPEEYTCAVPYFITEKYLFPLYASFVRVVLE